MFPIPWNFPFRKNNGDLTTIGDAISSGGGGGSELPPHSIADAGKVLGVNNSGNLAWVTVSAGGNQYASTRINIPDFDVTANAKGGE